MLNSAIKIHNLTKYYGPHRGIEDVSLKVEQGEVFGFLGPNGSGKTTTIRLLLDLLRPTSGSAQVLGLDCQKNSLETRQLIGYLPSEFHLYDNMTGGEILRFLGSVGRDLDWPFTEELAEDLGAELHRSTRTLSHGNKQKLAIILALQSRSPLLILDEPTNGLDPLVQKAFFAQIQKVRDEGRTVFLSSHNLNEVERICDRVALIRNGRLVVVDKVSAIREESLRLVTLTCARPLPPTPWATLPGIDHLVIDGKILSCTVRGPLGPLLAMAAPFEILDLLSREPNLEEYFLARFGNPEASHAR